MLKRLLKCVREYKLPAILTVVFIALEAVVETMIPFRTAELINKIEADNIVIGDIIEAGVVLILMAIVSLTVNILFKVVYRVDNLTAIESNIGQARNQIVVIAHCL